MSFYIGPLRRSVCCITVLNSRLLSLDAVSSGEPVKTPRESDKVELRYLTDLIFVLARSDGRPLQKDEKTLLLVRTQHRTGL